MTVTCAESEGMPLVIVHACRSCTSVTPSIAIRCSRIRATSTSFGADSNSTAPVSRNRLTARGTIRTAIINDAIGSARSQPVARITTAAAIAAATRPCR